MLDALTVSTRAMALRLNDGRVLRGYAGAVALDTLKELLGTDVVLEGGSAFRPSGEALRIEVESAFPAMPGDVIWAHLPKVEPTSSRITTETVALTGLDAFFGKWPGDRDGPTARGGPDGTFVKLDGQQLVLDTNILVHWLRGTQAGETLRTDYDLGARRHLCVTRAYVDPCMARALRRMRGRDRHAIPSCDPREPSGGSAAGDGVHRRGSRVFERLRERERRQHIQSGARASPGRIRMLSALFRSRRVRLRRARALLQGARWQLEHPAGRSFPGAVPGARGQ